MRLNAPSSDGNLAPGVITCAMGIRYKTYASLMARTFFIDPAGVSVTSILDDKDHQLTDVATREVLLMPAGGTE